MSLETKSSQWTLLPGKLGAPMLRVTSADMTTLGIMGVITLGLFNAYSMAGLIAGAGLTYVLMLQMLYVRLYDQLLIVTPQALYHRYVRKGVNWNPESKRSAIDYQLKDLPSANIGLNFNVNRPDEVSVVLAGSGSFITSMSVDDMHATHERMAADLTKISIKRGLEVAVGFGMRLRPWDPYKQLEFEQTAYHGDVLYPKLLADGESTETTDQDRFCAEQYRYNQEVIRKFDEEDCTKPTMMVVVTIRQHGAKKKGMKQAIYEDEVLRLPIIQIAHRAKAMLEARTVQDVEILNLPSLREVFRESWDINKLSEYREAARLETLSPHGHWPSEIIRTTKSMVQIDQTFHGLIRITETAEVGSPTHILQLFGGPCQNRTVSMVTQSMRSRGDYYLTGIMIDLTEGLRDWIGMSRMRPAAKARAEKRHEHEEVSYQLKYRQLYDYFIDIPANSPDELEQEVEGMLDYFDTLGGGISAQRVVAPEPILYRLVWRAITGVM